MPRLMIMETPALNAFASGIRDKNYQVTLTRGLLNSLDDEELEAVIAHELCHIQHKDVRMLIIAVIFVGIFAFVGESLMRGVFRTNLSRSDHHRRSGGGNAGAVELTKNPDAMIRALQKISGRAAMPEVPEEVQEMAIENPRTGFAGMFATHPPIEKRIEALVKYAGGRA